MNEIDKKISEGVKELTDLGIIGKISGEGVPPDYWHEEESCPHCGLPIVMDSE
jgi:hypothetical protein